MADQTADSRPAGWRKDPSGRHYGRFWDGTQWTEHVISAEKVQSVDPLTPEPVQSSPVPVVVAPVQPPAVRQAPARPQRLASERVVVSAPMSFVGSAGRLWKLTDAGPPPMKALTIPLAMMLALMAWAVICCWYLLFGLLLVPYRLLRRGSRKRKRDELRHRETLQAIDRQGGGR